VGRNVALHKKPQGAPFDFAFLGGSVLSLLVSDPTADAIRVTKDVDIIAGVRTRKDFHREERELEAFEDRGKGDFICNTDFEDIICLFNGRPSTTDETLAEPTVGPGIAEKFAHCVMLPDLEDAIAGFAQTESNPDIRLAAIRSAFRRLAESA